MTDFNDDAAASGFMRLHHAETRFEIGNGANITSSIGFGVNDYLVLLHFSRSGSSAFLRATSTSDTLTLGPQAYTLG